MTTEMKAAFASIGLSIVSIGASLVVALFPHKVMRTGEIEKRVESNVKSGLRVNVDQIDGKIPVDKVEGSISFN